MSLPDGATADPVSGIRRIRSAVRGLVAQPGGRLFTLLSFTDAFGTGLFLAAGAVFFARSVGLTSSQIGTGLGVAGFVGLAASVPMGALADRVGTRRMLVVVQFWRACCFVAYATAASFVAFLLVACFTAVAQSISGALTQALVPQLVGEEHRVRIMAVVRTVRNVGFALGAMASAPLIALDSRPALQAVVLADAASFVLAGVLLARMPLLPGADVPTRVRSDLLSTLGQFRDWRYAGAAALNIVFSMHLTLVVLIIPLWTIFHTSAPTVLVSVLLLVNTAMAAVLQIPLSRRAESIGGSIRMIGWAGAALAACCGLMALAPAVPTAVAVVVLLAGMVAMTLGEIWQSAAAWTISYAFAPVERRVQYLAIFNLSGVLMQDVFGPLLLAGLLLQFGSGGWLVLAVAVLVAIPPFRRVVRAMERAEGPG